MGATPDGRKKGEFPSETLSPSQGQLGPKKGITACVNSLTKYYYVLVGGGGVTNYKITPKDVEGDEGLRRLVHIIDVCFQKMGLQMQFNVADAETLRDAQKHPENYPNLMVRVAGYSALFVDLEKDIQDDIINRATLRF